MALASDAFGDTYLGLRAMAELAMTGPGVPIEFEFGLDLILDRLGAAARGNLIRATVVSRRGVAR